jgi:hypothetical protein
MTHAGCTRGGGSAAALRWFSENTYSVPTTTTVSDLDESAQPARESARVPTTPIMASRARIIRLRRGGRGDTRLPDRPTDR